MGRGELLLFWDDHLCHSQHLIPFSVFNGVSQGSSPSAIVLGRLASLGIISDALGSTGQSTAAGTTPQRTAHVVLPEQGHI